MKNTLLSFLALVTMWWGCFWLALTLCVYIGVPPTYQPVTMLIIGLIAVIPAVWACREMMAILVQSDADRRFNKKVDKMIDALIQDHENHLNDK